MQYLMKEGFVVKKNALLVLVTVFLVLLCTTAIALDGKSGPYSYTVKKNGDLCI